jgi:hypothetical protein
MFNLNISRKFFGKHKKYHDILRLHRVRGGRAQVQFVTPTSSQKLPKSFHPAGELEAPIGGVIKPLRYASTAAPLNALPMKTSNS